MRWARRAQVLRSWFAGRQGVSEGGAKTQGTRVGGNLARQFASAATVVRLARNVRHLAHWETSYFEHFAKVPEESWHKVLAAPGILRRDRARQQFHETVGRYESKDPVDRIMRWDVDTYLTGLFHQDDRMSMAASLESRVPFADPKMARFAFGINPNLKLRGGASKWILRQAVSSVVPPLVLNRRKVGFDTPALRWMTDLHAGFVQETLLSSKARQRGFWNAAEIERLLGHSGAPGWLDIVWKLLSIEVWASVFAGGSIAPAGERALSETHATQVKVGYLAREFIEMGRAGHAGAGVVGNQDAERAGAGSPSRARAAARVRISGCRTGRRLPFTAPGEMRGLFSPPGLTEEAAAASRGRIVCFSKWVADYGNPIDWHRDPTNGHRWMANAHWSQVLAGSDGSEVKLTWEAARFPQAYAMARAAAFCRNRLRTWVRHLRIR